MAETRKNVRFSDIGRVEAFGICELPGILEDISLTGCKVHFPIPVKVDMDLEYELKIYPSRKCASGHDFVLICQPRWINGEGEDSSIGFSILHSPGTQQLKSYIEYLNATENSENTKENNTKIDYDPDVADIMKEIEPKKYTLIK
ncbi:MAG: PilZ domain-containing protein [Treponema sp.]|nr:PilZ domain-containing protein [Treponema sp.]